jgi:hypothetical protein
MKIGCVSADWEMHQVHGRPALHPGGTNWIRMHVPGVELRKHGYELVSGGLLESMPDGRMRLQDFQGDWHEDCDLIWMQRWMPADPMEGPRLVAAAVAAGQAVVNDLDDHHWALPSTIKLTSLKGGADRDFACYRRMLAASTAVICSTPLLERMAERWGTRAFLCRNAIDLDRWKFDGPGTHIGYVGAVAGHAQDVPILREGIVPLLKERDLAFYHGGAILERPIQPRLGYENVVVRRMCSPAEYPSLWAPIAVGLVPLEDSTFNRAKSWIKGLEACARGIPFIASDLPEYRALGVGRLAKRRSEWRRHLTELLDPEVRAREGAVNYWRASELSIARRWRDWSDVFDLVAPSQASQTQPVRPLVAAST